MFLIFFCIFVLNEIVTIIISTREHISRGITRVPTMHSSELTGLDLKRNLELQLDMTRSKFNIGKIKALPIMLFAHYFISTI